MSATLKTVLEDRMELPSGSGAFLVTVGPPKSDQGETVAAERSRVNLFLYRVTENGVLKNQEIPGQGTPGSYGHPPLSLDLHYLLTAYGTAVVDEDFVDETRAQELLGSAMRVLHDYPLITDDLRTVKTPTGRPILHESLRREFERVKVSLDPLSLEDVSKVWTALTHPFRLSAAYTVNVVQIESRRPRRSALLVGEPPDAGPRVAAVPMRRPRVESIRVRRPGEPPDVNHAPHARVGDTLVLEGRDLSGEGLRVRLGGVDVTAALAVSEGDRIEVAVPDDPALKPGPQPVEVALGPTGMPPVFLSNATAFLLVPTVTGVSTVTGPKRVKVTGSRLFDPDLQTVGLVGDRVVTQRSFTKRTPTEVVFRPPLDLPAGQYAVRVRVSGAESIDEAAVTL